MKNPKINCKSLTLKRQLIETNSRPYVLVHYNFKPAFLLRLNSSPMF